MDENGDPHILAEHIPSGGRVWLHAGGLLKLPINVTLEEPSVSDLAAKMRAMSTQFGALDAWKKARALPGTVFQRTA